MTDGLLTYRLLTPHRLPTAWGAGEQEEEAGWRRGVRKRRWKSREKEKDWKEKRVSRDDK